METAKDDMDALRQDNKRGMQRAPWEEVAASFHAIHQNATTWANRPAALFKAAECYEELSRRSFAISDARKAAGTFEKWPGSTEAAARPMMPCCVPPVSGPTGSRTPGAR